MLLTVIPKEKTRREDSMKVQLKSLKQSIDDSKELEIMFKPLLSLIDLNYSETSAIFYRF
jgi:hypothetical protein